ncbi:MAG: hypothetical protein M3Z10_07775 [Gemmatimonadota bacterium]|nr:hypothetical protein [Gemmatimonadota bacterium]
MSETRREVLSLEIVRKLALIAVVVGAAGSLGLMLIAGGRNPSRLLIVLFAGWVVAPFIALGWTTVISPGWPVLVRLSVYVVTFVVTLGSFAIYGALVLGALRAKTGFVFLVVPAVSWLLLAIALAIAVMKSGRRGPRS